MKVPNVMTQLMAPSETALKTGEVPQDFWELLFLLFGGEGSLKVAAESAGLNAEPKMASEGEEEIFTGESGEDPFEGGTFLLEEPELLLSATPSEGEESLAEPLLATEETPPLTQTDPQEEGDVENPLAGGVARELLAPFFTSQNLLEEKDLLPPDLRRILSLLERPASPVATLSKEGSVMEEALAEGFFDENIPDGFSPGFSPARFEGEELSLRTPPESPAEGPSGPVPGGREREEKFAEAAEKSSLKDLSLEGPSQKETDSHLAEKASPSRGRDSSKAERPAEAPLARGRTEGTAPRGEGGLRPESPSHASRVLRREKDFQAPHPEAASPPHLHRAEVTSPPEAEHAVSRAESVSPAELPEFVKEMVVKLHPEGKHEAQLKLHPPELGEMHLSVSVDRGEVKLLLTVEHPRAAEVIQQHLHQLEVSFQEMGLQFGGAEINLAGGQGQFNPSEGREGFVQNTIEGSGEVEEVETTAPRRRNALIDIRV